MAARRVGVGKVFHENRARPEEVGPHLHVLDDFLAERQVRVRPVNAAVDDSDAHTSARHTELGPDSIGPDEGDTLVEEVPELTVEVDGGEVGQGEQPENLRRGAPHADHREHPEPEGVNARGRHQRENGHARIPTESQDSLDRLGWPGGMKDLLENRVDLDGPADLDGRQTQELGEHGPPGEGKEPDHHGDRRGRHVPPFPHTLISPFHRTSFSMA